MEDKLKYKVWRVNTLVVSGKKWRTLLQKGQITQLKKNTAKRRKVVFFPSAIIYRSSFIYKFSNSEFWNHIVVCKFTLINTWSVGASLSDFSSINETSVSFSAANLYQLIDFEMK